MYGRNSESESGMTNYFNSTTSNVCEVLNCMDFTHIPLDEMSVISLITSSNTLCWAKMIEFGFNCLRHFFARVQLTIDKSCSGDGLVPNMRQAISWTNVDPHRSGPHDNPHPHPIPHPIPHPESLTVQLANLTGRSPKVVAFFLLQTLVAIWYDFFQLHDTNKMKSNHIGINYNYDNIAIWNHIMIYNSV